MPLIQIEIEQVAGAEGHALEGWVSQSCHEIGGCEQGSNLHGHDFWSYSVYHNLCLTTPIEIGGDGGTRIPDMLACKASAVATVPHPH